MPIKVNLGTERWFIFENIRPKGEPISGELFKTEKGNLEKFMGILDEVARKQVGKFSFKGIDPRVSCVHSHPRCDACNKQYAKESGPIEYKDGELIV
jgi:hypothetical protein